MGRGGQSWLPGLLAGGMRQKKPDTPRRMATVMAHPHGLDDPSEERISQEGILFLQRGSAGRLPPDTTKRRQPLLCNSAGIGVVGFA